MRRIVRNPARNSVSIFLAQEIVFGYNLLIDCKLQEYGITYLMSTKFYYFSLLLFKVCDLQETIVNAVEDVLKLIEIGNRLR